MSSIRDIRKKVLGLSQTDLARIAGVKQSTVSRWESGELSPSLSDVSKIVTAAGGRITANDFLIAHTMSGAQ